MLPRYLALVSWCGGVQPGLGRVALSVLPVHPSGMASLGRATSSSEDTSSSSDETDLEVIAARPRELPSTDAQPSLPGAGFHRPLGPDQFSTCFRVTGSWKG